MEWMLILRNKRIILFLLSLLFFQTILFALRPTSGGFSGEERAEYIESFHSGIQDILNQANAIGSIGIFSKNDSFSDRNLEKTKHDYQKMLYVEPVSCDGAFLESVFDYTAGNLISVFACICLVILYNRNEKTGLKCLLYSSKQGRGRLVFRRISAMLLWNEIITVVGFLLLLGVSIALNGGSYAEIYRYPIQSLPMFSKLPMTINVREFIVLYLLYRWLINCLVSVFFWMLLSVCDNVSFAIGALGFVVVLNYFAYQLINVNHTLNHLHYCNLWYLLQDVSFFSEYKNLNVFSFAISKNTIVLTFVFFVMALSGLISVILGEYRYPISSVRNRFELWERIVKRFLERISSHVQENLPPIGVECYKFFISEKGFLILIVLMVMFWAQVDTTEVSRSGDQVMYYDYVDRYCGIPSDDSQQELEDLEAELANVEQDYMEKCASYEAGELSVEDYINANIKYDAYENERTFYEYIEKQTDYLNDLKDTRGIFGWYVNNYSYNHLFQEDRILWNTVLIFGVALLCSGLFSIEKKTGMVTVIRGTRGGRGRFFWHKILVACVSLLVIYIIFSIVEVAMIWKIYGLEGLAAPIQSLEQFSFVFPKLSIGSFIFLIYLCKGILLLSIAMIISSLSVFFEQRIVMEVLSVLCIPTVFVLAGFKYFQYVSLPQLLSPTLLLVRIKSVGALLFVVALFVLCAAVIVAKAYRKWCVVYED